MMTGIAVLCSDLFQNFQTIFTGHHHIKQDEGQGILSYISGPPVPLLARTTS